MKRSIINKLSQLSEELKGYVGALNYRYMNLCVKAEEASMLPIQVPIEDQLKNIEDGLFNMVRCRTDSLSVGALQLSSADDAADDSHPSVSSS